MYQPIGACLPFYALNFLFILSNSSLLFLSFFFLSVLFIFVVILLEVPITLFMIFFSFIFLPVHDKGPLYSACRN